MTLGVGIHDEVPAEEYHADPCEQPSLSAHTIHTLLSRSPLHAWTHAKLNPDYRRTERDAFDLGTAVHDLWLRGTTDAVTVVESDDWRTKYAQEKKAEARALGMTPLLVKDWRRVREMTEAIREQLAARDDDPPLFGPGKPEQTLIWEENGVTCRARLDWLHDSYEAVDDLKSCRASANPHDWGRRTLWTIGADIQVVMYRRGVKALTGVTPDFRYCLAETEIPYAIAVVSLAPSALDFAEAKVDRALSIWKECLGTGVWPSYPREVAFAELPPWIEQQWWDMEAAEEIAA